MIFRQMGVVLATFAMLLRAAMLLPAATIPTALGQIPPSASVAPSGSVQPSASRPPDAVVELFLGFETETARDWAIKVTGGSPSVDFATVNGVVGGRFTVEVLGPSAQVEMTVTLPSGRVLEHGDCFEPLTGVEHDSFVAPDRIVLQVVQGGFYSCFYGTRQAGPTQAVPHGVQVDLFSESKSRVGRTWDIAVGGGNAQPNVLNLDDFGGAFHVFFFGPSATVEMTVRLPPGWALRHGVCFFHDESVRRDVLAGPRQLVLEVAPNGDASCDYLVGRTGGPTAPPTDSLAVAQTRSSSGGWPSVLALMVAVAAGVLIAACVRLRR